MISLRANPELKHTFERLIKTMGANVAWHEIFVVLNNFLILPGQVRSLIFNFDNKKVITNILDIPVEEEDIQDIAENALVTNGLDMVLYAFGKWGVISGLKVEQDYSQLNGLFSQILRELKIEPGFRDDNFRFYREGIQITYEDVIQAALEAGKKKEQEEAEAEEEEEKLGLWHKVRWITHSYTFPKDQVSPREQQTLRIGNNFYIVGYQCPVCGEKLYMVVYPVDQEFLAETDEGRVYLARAYTCDGCSRFYTPRPGKLLSEGDVYVLDFSEDRKAYEDYQELLGSRGEKTSNYKFNEYEKDRNKKKEESEAGDTEETEAQEEEPGGAEGQRAGEPGGAEGQRAGEPGAAKGRRAGGAEGQRAGESGGAKGRRAGEPGADQVRGAEEPGAAELEALTEEKLLELEEKIDSGFYPSGRDGALYKKVREEAARRKKVRETVSDGKTASDIEKETREESGNQTGKGKTEAESLARTAGVRKKYDARIAVANRLSSRQLRELASQIQKEKLLTEQEKEKYLGKVNQYLYQSQKRELEQKAESCGRKNYAQMARTIEEIEKSDYPAELKEPILQQLHERKKQQAQKEAEELIQKMPAAMDRKRYQLFREKLRQYREADITPYEAQLEARREQAEKQEIAALVNRTSKNDRNALFRVWEKLKGPDFSKENTQKVLEQLHDRIRALDEAAIDKMCPDLMEMTFEEGMEAYQKIESRMFLPEIKTNALEMIDKRLTKMKTDESELLVRKLKDELSGKVSVSSRIHYYEARKASRGEWEGEEADIVNRAGETYAADCSRYEYPILVCDSSRKATGGEGFLLTPDHLFYNSTFSSESIPVTAIKSVTCSMGILNKGIYVNQKNGEKTKIPCGINAKEWQELAKVLNDFIKYLQEKPESRSVSYLAKEEHEVKCCFRCGYTYREGSICPKCGNKANK